MPFKKRAEKTYDEHSLYEYAVGALGRKMRTVAELKRLMRTKTMRQSNSADLIEQVVARLKEQRYLNDSQYAAAYSNYRKENEKFGRRRVEQDLKVKGVHGDVISKALTTAYEGVNELDLAREYVRRKRIAQPKDQKEAAKLFRRLARAGFSSGVASTVLKQWEVDDDTITMLEQERMAAEESATEDEEGDLRSDD